MAALERFVTAQQPVYAQALGELKAGRKESHWMWFVFPQIAGLGHSAMAQHYAIADVGEAWSYSAHPVLGMRLIECTDAMLAWASTRSAQAILGAVDAMKFRSSMTLFEAAGGDPMFGVALDRFFSGNRDGETLEILAAIEA